jgi:hypothetical protein
VVAPAAEPEEFFDNIDKWYERYDREVIGKYVLYKLRLR